MKKCLTCGNFPVRGVTVDALIVMEGKILLIKRKKNPFANLWALPGGHLDFNETLEEAVIREVKEETGLTVTSHQFFGVFSDPNRHPKQAIAVAYEVKTQGIPKAGDDVVEIKFFPIRKLPQKLAFDHKQIISNYLRFLKLG